MDINLSSFFRNKAVLLNTAIIASVLITIIILNTPTQIDYEELTTIPYDYTPNPYVKEWTTKQMTVEIKQPELFTVDHAVYTVTTTETNIPVTTVRNSSEYQPYPMSPASSILVCNDINPNDTVLVLAIKKMDTTPTVYVIVVDDTIRCYFSDPFPTGYNSILVFIRVDANIDNLRIEIRKVRELG